jgi:hypothetical protein
MKEESARERCRLVAHHDEIFVRQKMRFSVFPFETDLLTRFYSELAIIPFTIHEEGIELFTFSLMVS